VCKSYSAEQRKNYAPELGIQTSQLTPRLGLVDRKCSKSNNPQKQWPGAHVRHHIHVPCDGLFTLWSGLKAKICNYWSTRGPLYNFYGWNWNNNQNTCITIIKTNQLMQFCDIIAVYFENHTEFLNCVWTACRVSPFKADDAVIHCALKFWHGMDGQSVEWLSQCRMSVSSHLRDTGNIVERPSNSVPGDTTVLPMHLQYPTDYR